jgi:flagellar hook-length control protein FliK
VHLIPLRRGPDGTHRLTAHLHPEDLGQITVIAEVRRGEITVQLAGSTEAGRLALAAGLPELRQEMLDSGFGSCSLELVADSPGDQTGQRQALADQGGPDRRPAPDARSEDDRSSQRNGPTGGDQDPATTTSGDDRAPRRGVDLHV